MQRGDGGAPSAPVLNHSPEGPCSFNHGRGGEKSYRRETTYMREKETEKTEKEKERKLTKSRSGREKEGAVSINWRDLGSLGKVEKKDLKADLKER